MLLGKIFLVFLYIGIFSFGGGNAMFPLLTEELVSRHQWLTQAQLVDLFALAQMTPGPVATNAATFVGYKLAGFWGSMAATLAVSLPSMAAMVGLARFTATSREDSLVEGVLYGLRPMVVALILAAAVEIGRQSLVDPAGWVILIGAVAAAYRRLNPMWIILTGGIIGLVIY